MPRPKKQLPEAESDSSDDESDCSTLVASQKQDELKRRKLDDISKLFAGGHGFTWEPLLRPAIENQSNWREIIGPDRDRSIVPIREMTFQAIKANPPDKWKVIIFGQNPYPRVESATGIAMFDNTFDSWNNKRFGAVTSLRCMLKSACMYKYNLGKTDSVTVIRKVLLENNIVQPPQWFQSLLFQGVLLLNATLTTGGPARSNHTKFWNPIITEIVKCILSQTTNDQIVFAWWGNESLKTRKMLEPVFKNSKVSIKHIVGPNPAAQGDIFCSDESPFESINNALGKGSEIEWLPSTSWLEKQKSSKEAAKINQIGDFIATTQELHKLFLDRLKDGLEVTEKKGLQPITGIINSKPLSLVEACENLVGVLEKAEESLEYVTCRTSETFKHPIKLPFGMSLDEAASITLYTSPVLFKRVNDALRNPDRSKAKPYFGFLKIFFSALSKLKRDPNVSMLYRGVSLDFSKQLSVGDTSVWWGISSCTSSRKVAEKFMGNVGPRTLFCVSPSSTPVGVKLLSAYSAEEEYILMPGTQFVVKNVKKSQQFTEIHLQELEADLLVC
eukprot:TRINITY_DN8847_c0_g1_i1.p1 TRINITY_DN8847_c0_g1~~TRINITY_DN8847_c0_g1_i1.p1  ORF type:complete len:558 (+),score=73.15 TRINITY_DN8847_c0_g1_i1:60-1733(+)